MHFPRLLPTLTAALAGAAFTASAADWPQWRGPLRTGHVAAGEKLLTTLPTEPKVRWRAKVGEGVASPVVAVGKGLHRDGVKTGGELLCLDRLAK